MKKGRMKKRTFTALTHEEGFAVAVCGRGSSTILERKATNCGITYSSVLYSERLVAIRMKGLLMLSTSANLGRGWYHFR